MIDNPVYSRTPGIIVKRLEDEVLLIDETTDSIFNLNQMGTAVWNLLKEPRTIDEIVEVLVAAFPATPSKKITEDTIQLLERLMDKGLLEMERNR